jgi:transposase
MDMSTEFRRAVRKALPKAAITVDHWHVVAWANQMGHRGPPAACPRSARQAGATDPACKYRKLLTCNQENMCVSQRGRTHEIIASDLELGVVWGIKEHVRQLLKTDHVDGFHRAWAELEHFMKATRMREAKSLFLTLKMWRRELLTFYRARVTNARSEAANLNAKNLKRAGHGYRNHDHYRLPAIVVHGSPTRHAEHPPPRQKWKSRLNAKALLMPESQGCELRPGCLESSFLEELG